MSRFRFKLSCLLIFALLLSALPALAANSVRKLPPEYRHWLEAEVNYIITSDERKQFLALDSDTERDSFIAAFWRVRNPEGNSEINSYKEEHYRRLAYVNQHFGDPRYGDGWRTAMGHVYIVLGPPKQRAPYHEKPNIRNMEIWFYEAQTPALPPYFNVVFWKHSGAEEWRLYSPTQDGPTALVTTGESQNNNRMALRLIKQSVGNEAAKTVCSLIPSEPVDFDNFEPSMESDMLLATINGLADNPLNKQMLQANRLREHVTTSVLVGDQDASLGYDVVRDEKGRETLSYLLRMGHADARFVGTKADGESYYDLTLRTSVATPEGKSVYDQEDALTGTLTAAQAEVAKKKRFGAEGRLPLAPGTYLLESTLTNNLNHIATKKRLTVTVPSVKPEELGLSPLLEYAPPAAVPDPQGKLPFSISKLRFTPRGAQSIEIKQGEHLPIVFQLWAGANTAQNSDAAKIHLRYVFGTVTATHQTPAEEREDVDASNHDAVGNLLTGHKIDTSTLEPGTYRLVVSATRDSDHRAAYAAMSVRVIPASEFVEIWTAYGPSNPGGDAVDDLKRGMSAEALGNDTDAQAAYAAAVAESSADVRPVEKLAALLARKKDADELARLGQQPILQKDPAEPKTLVLIAAAMRAHGDNKGAVRLLDAQIKLQPPTVELYRSLADACEATGDAGRARELRTLATNIK